MKNLLIRSSIFRYFEIMVAMVTSLLLTPYLITHLGEDDYGLWILILSTLGWFSFVDLGFSSAVQRELIFAIEKSDQTRRNQVFSCSIVLFSFLGLIATLGVFSLGVYPQLLGIPSEKLETSSIVITILCLKIFMDFVMNSVHGIFAGHLRYDIDANISTASALLKAALTFASVESYGIYGVVFATMCSDILMNLVKVYFIKRLQPDLRFSIALVSFDEIKAFMAYSKHVIASIIARTINTKSDPIIIAYILDVSAITMFNIADRLANMIESLVNAIAGVFQPVFFKLESKKVDISDTFYFVVSINSFVAGVLFIPMAILANDFIILWVGEKFSFAHSLVFILVFAFLARTISRPITSVLLARAQHKTMSLVNLFGAILNIFLSIYLGSIYGLIGIVLSTSISFVLSDVLIYLFMLKHYTRLAVKTIFLRFILLSAFYVLMVFGGKWYMQQTTELTWLNLFIDACVVFFINLVFCWFLLLTKQAKEKLISVIIGLPILKKIRATKT